MNLGFIGRKIKQLSNGFARMVGVRTHAMGCLIFDQYGIAPEFNMLQAAKSTRNAVTEFSDNEPSEPVAENPVCKVAPELPLLVGEGLQVVGLQFKHEPGLQVVAASSLAVGKIPPHQLVIRFREYITNEDVRKRR